VNEHLLAASGVYIIGDANGRVLLAHAAEDQARYVLAHLCGENTVPYQAAAMPACIYGHIEVMRVGMNLRELISAGAKMEVSRIQLIANPMTQASGVTMGFIKIYWADGIVKGITAVGHGVTRLTGLSSAIVAQGWEKKDAHSIIYAHPSLDESLEQALMADREAVGVQV
jgi:dihydrolipoamide dehydrogenase